MGLHPVVMAGGSGTRFWPLSRRRRPKQLLPLASEQPLIADTIARLPPLAQASSAYVVCGKLHAPIIRRMVPELARQRVLVEPVARNTAPCIGLAAVHVRREDPEGVLLVLPSDHHVRDPAGLRAALGAAAEVAADGSLVTIGIQPSRPETGYGYVHIGSALGERAGREVYKVQRFVEKPDATTARAYVECGEYLWNAGIFVFRADAILAEIARHLPALHAALEGIAPTVGTARYARTLAKAFPTAESISVDYGVMEKASRIACVPGNFGWSDVGSFAALPEVRGADPEGNVVRGRALLPGCSGCIVMGDGRRLVAGVGLRDLVIVDAGDALLVVPRERAQEVRRVVDALTQTGDAKLL